MQIRDLFLDRTYFRAVARSAEPPLQTMVQDQLAAIARQICVLSLVAGSLWHALLLTVFAYQIYVQHLYSPLAFYNYAANVVVGMAMMWLLLRRNQPFTAFIFQAIVSEFYLILNMALMQNADLVLFIVLSLLVPALILRKGITALLLSVYSLAVLVLVVVHPAFDQQTALPQAIAALAIAWSLIGTFMAISHILHQSLATFAAAHLAREQEVLARAELARYTQEIEGIAFKAAGAVMRHLDTGSNNLPVLESPLSRRELEVLRLVAEGYNNREIAEQLIISEGTAKTHVAHIIEKFAARDRTHAAVLAERQKLL